MNGRVQILGAAVTTEAAPPAEKLKFYDAAYQRLMKAPLATN